MSSRLPGSAVLVQGRYYWIAVPSGGVVKAARSSAFKAVSLVPPFFPIGFFGSDRLGGLTVYWDDLTVDQVAGLLCEAWNVQDVAIVDAGSMSSALGLVVEGYATQATFYEIRDEALRLGNELLEETPPLLRALPWIVAGVAVLGLAFVLWMEVKG